jgi:hypothetical protein
MSEITISLFSARSAAIDQFSGAACEAGLPLQLGFAAASRFGLGLAPKTNGGILLAPLAVGRKSDRRARDRCTGRDDCHTTWGAHIPIQGAQPKLLLYAFDHI